MARRMIDIPKSLRPREKLCERSPEALSDTELLAVILGSGTRKRGVLELAGKILQLVDATANSPSLEELRRIEGVGLARATQILATCEFARRRARQTQVRIESPEQVLHMLQYLADRKQEHLVVLSLNGLQEIIEIRVVSVGLLSSAPIHPREVFADAITDRAAAIIMAHNHPAGSLEPSAADIRSTEQIARAGHLLGIPLLDHVIFSQEGYYSFRERSILKEL